MKVSIIIPAYNAENTIKRCLDSILLQTYADFEVLVVNNNSTDNTSNILNQYSSKDSRIITLFEKLKGVGYARNNALNHAKGELITFIDADDYVETNFLEVLVNNIEGKNSMSVCGIIEETLSKNNTIHSNYSTISITGDDIYISLINSHSNNGIAGYLWNKMFYMDAIGDIRFDPQITMCEDILFLLQIMNNINKINISKKNCYHYVRTENSACGKSYNGEKYFSKYIAHKELINLICKYTKNNLVIQLYANLFVSTCIELCAIIAKNNSYSSFLQMSKEMRTSIRTTQKQTQIESIIIRLYIWLLIHLPSLFWIRYKKNNLK